MWVRFPAGVMTSHRHRAETGYGGTPSTPRSSGRGVMLAIVLPFCWRLRRDIQQYLNLISRLNVVVINLKHKANCIYFTFNTTRFS